MSKVIDSFTNLPSTETLSTEYIGDTYLSADAELLISADSHVYLNSSLSELSYSLDTYQYRTATSGLSNTDLHRFLDIAAQQIKSSETKYDRIIEFGGSDLTLAKLLCTKVDSITVVDPISSYSNVPSELQESIEVIPKYDYELDYSRYSDEQVLVLSRHTIEHLKYPDQHFKVLSRQLNKSTVYIYEFPCFYSLLARLRFDAIFHQHLNYFDAFSFCQLITKHGFHVHSINHNKRGSCGGSIQVVFSQNPLNHTPRIDFPYTKLDPEDYIACYKQRKSLYSLLSAHLADQLSNENSPVYGFGAALMLPTFFYHSQLSPHMLNGLIDDDISKHGMTYSNLPLFIHPRSILSQLDRYSILITSNESFRSIYGQSNTLAPDTLYGLLPLS